MFKQFQSARVQNWTKYLPKLAINTSCCPAHLAKHWLIRKQKPSPFFSATRNQRLKLLKDDVMSITDLRYSIRSFEEVNLWQLITQKWKPYRLWFVSACLWAVVMNMASSSISLESPQNRQHDCVDNSFSSFCVKWLLFPEPVAYHLALLWSLGQPTVG